MALVYRATNTNNAHTYIGITTKTLRARQMQHFGEAARGGRRPFHAAIRKYGKDSFIWEVLEEHADEIALMAAEIRLIAEFRPEYNRTAGGKGLTGLRHSKEARAKMSAAQNTEESRARQRALRTGTKMSAEAKALMSVAMRRRLDAEGSSWTGRKHRPESIAKMSASHKGHPGYWKGKKLPPQVQQRFVDWAATPEQQEKWKVWGKLGPQAIQRKVVCADDGNIYDSVRLAARAYGLRDSAVCDVCRGGARTAKGLHFQYADGSSPEVPVRPKGKMTLQQVALVRKAVEYGASRLQLAWAFDRSHATINRILSGKTFRE